MSKELYDEEEEKKFSEYDTENDNIYADNVGIVFRIVFACRKVCGFLLLICGIIFGGSIAAQIAKAASADPSIVVVAAIAGVIIGFATIVTLLLPTACLLVMDKKNN